MCMLNFSSLALDVVVMSVRVALPLAFCLTGNVLWEIDCTVRLPEEASTHLHLKLEAKKLI